MMESIEESSFIETCETGDILLYNSKYWYSRLIEKATGSKFSHISIILRDPVYINPELKGLYILESGYENICDSNTGKRVFGVQIVPLEHTLDAYRNSCIGSLYYRKLEKVRTETFYKRLSDVIKHVEGKRYDINPVDWIKAKFDIEMGNLHKTNTFWCSALVGYIYSVLCLVDSEIPWSILPPRKFSYYENDRLTYKNCNLEPERNINLVCDL